ncbi:MAG: hypothetical protein P8P36_08610 [Akkermansiaceae bacterium]|nr:hypothetical protein [Akkermansiaceae bacterium]
MRIPIPTVVTLSISIGLAVWFVATREMNFAQEPTPEDYVQISEEWAQSKPHIRPINSAENQRSAAKSRNTSQLVTAHLKKNKDQYPFIDFKLEPTLSEHGILQDKGPAYMSRFAAHLESVGQQKHALLAWERVIDTTTPDDEQRKRAITSIHRLKTTLPPWSSEPQGIIPLTLHVGASINNTQSLQQALETTAANISKASGGLIHTETKLSLGKKPNNQTASLPMALWLSRPATSNEGKQAETVPTSFMADSDDVAALVKKLQAGVYEIVRKNLSQKTGFTKLPEHPADLQGESLLEYHITRLMWREFVNGMFE